MSAKSLEMLAGKYEMHLHDLLDPPFMEDLLYIHIQGQWLHQQAQDSDCD